MPRTKSVQDPALLEAALEGLKIQQKKIEEQIGQVNSLLGHHTVRRGRPPAKKAATGKKRVLSAAARKRIAAAQRRRWAQFRKNASAAAE